MINKVTLGLICWLLYSVFLLLFAMSCPQKRPIQESIRQLEVSQLATDTKMKIEVNKLNIRIDNLETEVKQIPKWR